MGIYSLFYSFNKGWFCFNLGGYKKYNNERLLFYKWDMLCEILFIIYVVESNKKISK